MFVSVERMLLFVTFFFGFVRSFCICTAVFRLCYFQFLKTVVFPVSVFSFLKIAYSVRLQFLFEDYSFCKTAVSVFSFYINLNVLLCLLHWIFFAKKRYVYGFYLMDISTCAF